MCDDVLVVHVLVLLIAKESPRRESAISNTLPCDPLAYHTPERGQSFAHRNASNSQLGNTLLIFHFGIYIYIYIYTYIWGPISQVQGPKAGISRRADSAKNNFLPGPVSESTFVRLQDARKRVPSAFGIAFGVVWQLLGNPKTCDSVQYIL